jgi:hypothetical protein
MTRSLRAWLHRATLRPRVPRTAGPILALAVVLGACGSSIPVVSFDPSSACTSDGRQPGAYPELEAMLPSTFQGKAPDNVDSGRNCTPASLGALADAGIEGVRFAGATWGLGGSTGLTFAVFEGAGLDAGAMRSFYEQSASTDRHTEKLSSSDVTVGGAAGRRLDVLASNGAGHTIVAWPADRADTVFVLLASDLGDSAVTDALAELAGT